MAEAFTDGLVVMCTMESGETTKRMAKENKLGQTVMFTMENGEMT